MLMRFAHIRLVLPCIGVPALWLSTACSLPPAKQTGAAPIIREVITEPSPPVAPRIRWTLRGAGFDPENVRVFFTGPGCPDGCGVPPDAIDRRTVSEISGLADLGVGPYQIAVRNGDGAPISNAVSITLKAAGAD